MIEESRGTARTITDATKAALLAELYSVDHPLIETAKVIVPNDPIGGFTVVDWQTSTVAAFDSTGQLIWGGERRGAGPGELRLGLVSGSASDGGIVVLDAALRRVTTFDARGSVDRLGAFPDGPREAVTRGSKRVRDLGPLGLMVDRMNGQADSVTADQGGVFLVRNGVWDSLAPVRRQAVIYDYHSCDRTRMGTCPWLIAIPFHAVPSWDASGSVGMAWGSGETPTVELISLQDRSRRTVTLQLEPREVTASDRNLWLRDPLRKAAGFDPTRPADRKRAQELAAEQEIPKLYPYYSDLLFSSEGSLWLRRFPALTDTVARWQEVSLEGTLRQTIELPLSWKVGGFGQDAVLVLRPDADGLMTAVKYRIVH